MNHSNAVRLSEPIRRRIDQLAGDRVSGATDLAAEALAILEEARRAGEDLVVTAAAVVSAQPSMAPVWNAAVAAVASASDPQRLRRFAARLTRALPDLVRFAVGLFDPPSATPLRLVTLSASRAVEAVCVALGERHDIVVSCAEGRPAREGRLLAQRLAAAGLAVDLYSDAAIAHALDGAEALLVGADAVAAGSFLNKSGTRMAVAAAAQSSVPVYVAATRDKFVGDAVPGRITIRQGAPSEVWGAPPPGVTVRNPYFEWTPLDLVSAVISDAGTLGAATVADVCGALDDDLARAAVAAIAAQLR
jgi:translation initiation factor 2B subunit (eIF-2B alpha/beta/delta family)